MMRRAFITAVMLSFLTGCVPVRPWERMYVDDRDMALRARKIDAFERNAETYREGASGANGGKVGGGCGCN